MIADSAAILCDNVAAGAIIMKPSCEHAIIIRIIICNIHTIIRNFPTVLFWCEYRYFMVYNALCVEEMTWVYVHFVLQQCDGN
jgi:hypothetical protein